MNGSAFISYLLLLLLTSCSAQTPKEVLFIGNSLTYYHDMPVMLQKMLNEIDVKITVQQSTFPGVSLSDHLRQNVTLERLNQKWDFVILQEATVRMLIPEVRENSELSILKFDSLIKQNKGQTILYQSYPISIYPKKYCYPSILINKVVPEESYCSIELNNSTEEFDIIQSSFVSISNKIKGKIAPVGACFELCKKKYPELTLFESLTDTHPSTLGSYLIACVFFKHLTGKSVKSIKYSAGLNLQDVEKIKEIVDSM